MILQLKMNDGDLKVNTSNGNIKFNGLLVGNYQKNRKAKENIADVFEEYLNAKEWDSTVEKIQRWYYGSYVKDHWCATSLSYFASLVGLSDIVGKHENCDRMKEHFEKQNRIHKTIVYGGDGKYQPKRGDVVFMSNKFTYADITHVGVVSSINHENGEVNVISGNCENAIKYKTYNYKKGTYIIAFGKV
jgi:hypothetical protein